MSTLRGEMTVIEMIRALPPSLELFSRFGMEAGAGHRIDDDALLNEFGAVVRAA